MPDVGEIRAYEHQVTGERANRARTRLESLGATVAVTNDPDSE